MPKKVLFETPVGDYYAVPPGDADAAARILSRACRVQKLDWDQFSYDGPAAAQVFELPEACIDGLPARLRGIRKRRLTWWYFGSLTVVSYLVTYDTGLPLHIDAALDAGLIVLATLMTVWLRERDWI